MGKSRTGKEKAGVKAAGSPAASGKTGRESSAWPSSCVYLTSLVWGDDVRRAKDVYKKYKSSADGKHVEASAAATKRNVRWQLITDERHPAKGEYGLFAQRKLERGEMRVGDRRRFAVVRGISRRAWGRGVCVAQRRCLSLGPGRHSSKDTGAAESGLRIEVRV